MPKSEYWMYYHLTDNKMAYREGPFQTIFEARRAALEADKDLLPIRIWIEKNREPLWQRTR